MKNVLQLIGSFHQGGSERQAVQLSRLLDREGSFRIFIACLNGEGVLRPEVESFTKNEIPEFRLNSFYDANFLRQVRACAKFIRVHNISLVHTHDFYTNIFGMAAAKLSGVSVKIASKRETSYRTRAQELLERQAFRLADRVLANAEKVKEYLIEKGVPAKKISVVHNGLDLHKFRESSANLCRNETLKEFGLPVNGRLKFVTMVANLRSEVKNPRMFLRVAAHVKNQFPQARFVIAGEGELTDEMKSFAEEIDVETEVFFLGRCSRVAELLAASDVCVLSSKTEGFSNSILEYMAAGKPVVATDVGGASEAIREGETGFLVESDDDQSMATRVLELLNDDEKAARMGTKGREEAEKKFSLDAQLVKTLELYNRVLGQI
jgi:L-malate glycosyltransferase